MTNFSEVGHAKNVANFEDLINRCTGFGVSYNPSLAAIKITNMIALRTTALNALAASVSAGSSYMNAVDNRQLIFEPLQRLGTRIISALKACGASDAVIKDAESINRKIQGRRAKPVKEATNRVATGPVSTDAVHISVAQLSFDSFVEHFSKLIDFLSTVAVYNPNEADLKISGLNALLASMKASNTAVITATTNYINARMNRDNLIYGKLGVIEVAEDAKEYVRSVFGTRSVQYRSLTAITFNKRRED